MISVFILLSVAFAPQTTAPVQAAAQASGVAAPWDVRRMLDSLQAGIQRINPMLDQMKPEDWVQRGAPYAYVEQWKNSKVELGYFQTSAQALARRPEKLSQALDTFFRLEALDRQLRSLIQGARKYHNPAAANAMQAFLDEGSRNHDQMRQYVVDLARDKEQEFKVMDSEAQRCRSIVSRQPSAAGRQ
jgi:folylpolyglutamate synthase/dihydropteroate synthase